MNQPVAYLNGKLLPQSELALPLHDAGVVFGATLIEFCRTFQHQLYLLDRHLERFLQSCLLASVPCPVTREHLAEIAQEMVTHNAALLQSNQELALILLATPGPISHYAGQPLDNVEPTLALHTFPLPFERYSQWLCKGVALSIPSVQAIPCASLPPQIKHRSRLHWWKAQKEVDRQSPGTVALLASQQGHLTETAAANFLLARDGEILSPRRSEILNGISLGVVEELCHELGFSFIEKDIILNECRNAEEGFLCGTAFCLAPVQSIHGIALESGGPIYQRFLSHWSERVGVGIFQQITGVEMVEAFPNCKEA